MNPDFVFPVGCRSWFASLLLCTLTGCASMGVGVSIPVGPMSIGLGVGSGGVSVGASTSAGPVTAGVGVKSNGNSRMGVDTRVGVNSSVGGSGAQISVGVGTSNEISAPNSSQ